MAKCYYCGSTAQPKLIYEGYNEKTMQTFQTFQCGCGSTITQTLTTTSLEIRTPDGTLLKGFEKKVL